MGLLSFSLGKVGAVTILWSHIIPPSQYSVSFFSLCFVGFNLNCLFAVIRKYGKEGYEQDSQ